MGENKPSQNPRARKTEATVKHPPTIFRKGMHFWRRAYHTEDHRVVRLARPLPAVVLVVVLRIVRNVGSVGIGQRLVIVRVAARVALAPVARSRTGPSLRSLPVVFLLRLSVWKVKVRSAWVTRKRKRKKAIDSVLARFEPLAQFSFRSQTIRLSLPLYLIWGIAS